MKSAPAKSNYTKGPSAEAPSSSQFAPAPFRRPYFAAIILIVFTLAVFWRATDYGFLWDDAINVERNQYLKPVTLSNVAHFWREPFENLYVPLTYTVWGAIAHFAQVPAQGEQEMRLDPRLFHLANLVFHALNAVLVFAILRCLVENDLAAAAGALLFALHPVQVEPVAWVTGLKDVLSGFFSLVAVWQYLAYATAAEGTLKPSIRMSQEKSASAPVRQRIHYGIATAAFVLALLAKPAAVVVPVMAGVLDCCIVNRSVKKSMLSLSLWVAISLAFVILTKLQQPSIVIPLWQRPFVAADALAFYFYKVLLPQSLGPGYARSPEVIFEEGTVYLTWVIPLGVGAGVWYLRRREPWCIAATGLFVAALLPVLGIIPFQFQNWSTVADRYLYLSMLAPGLALSWIVAEQWNKRRWVGLICGTILLLLAVKTSFQVEIWRSSQTLWQYAIDVGQKSAVAYTNLGAALVDSDLERAIYNLREAVSLAPEFADAQYNLGIALARRSQHAEAIDHFRHVLKLKPVYPDVHYVLGVSLASSGQLDDAIYHYRQALQMKPADASVHNSLGNALADRGFLDEAIEHYRTAIVLKPMHAGAYFNLGIALADLGNIDEAAQQYRTTLQLKPEHAKAHNNLAVILAQQGNRQQAIKHFREALRIRPDFPEAQRGLARLLSESGKETAPGN